MFEEAREILLVRGFAEVDLAARHGAAQSVTGDDVVVITMLPIISTSTQPSLGSGQKRHPSLYSP